MDMSDKAGLKIIDSNVPSIEPEITCGDRVVGYEIVIDKEVVGRIWWLDKKERWVVRMRPDCVFSLKFMRVVDSIVECVCS